jgi:hypothetical protein
MLETQRKSVVAKTLKLTIALAALAHSAELLVK